MFPEEGYFAWGLSKG